MLKYLMAFVTSVITTILLGTITNDFFYTTFGTVVITILSLKFWKSFFKIIWTDYLEERL